MCDRKGYLDNQIYKHKEPNKKGKKRKEAVSSTSEENGPGEVS